jgi:thiamine-phosphate pyrophosphorylase
VVDRAAAGAGLEAAVAAAVAAGVDWVQVRERELPGAELLAHAERVAAAARRGAQRAGRELRILVNRRVDVALALGVDGAHLGFDAMAPEDARALLGPDALVGVSAHAAQEVPEPGGAASYAHVAPVFPPLSKPLAVARAPLGLAGLRAAVARGLPVLAQGGIDAAGAAAARAAGAAGVAVTGAILMADDPGRAAAALREALDA